jgi:hypothetical protein
MSELAPDLCRLIREWFLCGPITPCPGIAGLPDQTVAALIRLEPAGFLAVDVNFIWILNDACDVIDGMCESLIDQGLHVVLQTVVILSSSKGLTRAYLALLKTLIWNMASARTVDPAWVDAVLDKWPQLGEDVIKLALGPPASRPGAPSSQQSPIVPDGPAVQQFWTE